MAKKSEEYQYDYNYNTEYNYTAAAEAEDARKKSRNTSGSKPASIPIIITDPSGSMARRNSKALERGSSAAFAADDSSGQKKGSQGVLNGTNDGAKQANTQARSGSIKSTNPLEKQSRSNSVAPAPPRVEPVFSPPRCEGPTKPVEVEVTPKLFNIVSTKKGSDGEDPNRRFSDQHRISILKDFFEWKKDEEEDKRKDPVTTMGNDKAKESENKDGYRDSEAKESDDHKQKQKIKVKTKVHKEAENH